MVVEAARTAAGLTRQLLALSRQQPVTPKNIDVNDLVLDSTKLLLRILGEDIRLTCARTSEPLICHIDPTQFDQVILNLVVNARDAMPFGGNITVQTHPGTDVERSRWGWPDMPPGDYAVVEVTDTGTGIPPQIVPKIFEPFFTTKEVGKGTGLGLSTCYGIVKQAGGHIAVASEPGAGTTFTVFLPRVSALSATADLPEVPMPLTREDSSVILLVEDQKDLRTLAERALSAHGYTVVSTASPQEALEAARCARHIDLILSDLVMPGMDGAALLDELTAILGPRPALIMSGHAEESLLARIAGRSEVAFISKPFTLDSLVAEIQRTFGGWTDTVMVDGHASACD
jgi:two-component system cell cycle sensor histidine kinase/response regulator CckA